MQFFTESYPSNDLIESLMLRVLGPVGWNDGVQPESLTFY